MHPAGSFVRHGMIVGEQGGPNTHGVGPDSSGSAAIVDILLDVYLDFTCQTANGTCINDGFQPMT